MPSAVTVIVSAISIMASAVSMMASAITMMPSANGNHHHNTVYWFFIKVWLNSNLS
ncbi:MAG: hypothetical protein M0R21_09810 [Lentimicrobiaceae bacterium]|nr:hypothetical protein [Lentimicrobiaceae bacterium]